MLGHWWRVSKPAALSTDASNGVLNLNASGAFTYTPGASFSGVDNFTYVTQDAFTNSGPVGPIRS